MVTDSQTQGSSPNQGGPFYYLPDEICVVCSLSAGTKDSSFDPYYEAVRTHLNERIGNLLVDPASDDPYDQDMAPAPPALREHCYSAAKSTNGLLQRLYRSNGSSQIPLNPWVVIEREKKRSTALFFYKADVGLRSGDQPTQDHARTIRELVNVINWNRNREHRQLPTDDGWRILAATPHWLTAGCAALEVGGGPSAPPTPAPADVAPQKPPSDAYTVVDNGPGKVIVAILDTSPKVETVKAAADRYKNNNKENWLLTELAMELAGTAKRFMIDGTLPSALQRQPESFAHLTPEESQYLPHWGRPWDETRSRPLEHYQMPDHGLFVAGIVRSIVPTVDIRLIRVLSDYGVGDLHALTSVLASLPKALPLGDGDRLVINLSLTSAMPTSAELLRHWHPRSADSKPVLDQRWSDIAETQQVILRSLTDVIAWLSEDPRILLVAAAGNDGRGGQGLRPEPRLPARLDSRQDNVVGVVAVDAQGAPSYFSNRANSMGSGYGLAALGGNSRPIGGKISIVDQNGAQDAVIGVFSAVTLPFGGANTTGWAYWAGTSFSTAIVSGLAAKLWAQKSALDSAGVIAALHAEATAADPSLDCRVLPAEQVL
jgi:hypothetical protein